MLRVIFLVLIVAPFPFLQAQVVSEFIYETAPFPKCHASTIVELKNGDLLAAWFGGSDEGAFDVAVWGSRKTAAGWSAPTELAREPGAAIYNPVLFHTKDGVLWLSYKFGRNPSSWTGALRSSIDEGRNWSEIRHLPAGLYGPIKNKPLLLDDGTVIAGTSVESFNAWACWVERSTDNCASWTRHGPITFPGEPYGIIQPTIFPIGGGKLRMLVRSTQRIGRICYADSTDGGKTWTEARTTSLPNPNSGIDAAALKDGRIVLVYNHTERGRTPLNVAVSGDGGATWNMFETLELAPGEFSYPAVIQASNGDLHITYTWNRLKIKHAVIALKDIPNEQQP
jgi:predicted neuraminidase